MKQGITLLLALFSIISLSFAQNSDFLIYKENDLCIAKPLFNENIVVKDKSADVVFQELLEKIWDTGGSIEIMSGKYPVTKQIIVPSHVTISGKGTSSVVSIPETANIESVFYSDSTTKVIIKNLVIQSDNRNGEHSGIIFDHVGDGLVKDVSISGMGAYGIWYRDRTFLSEVRGCKISDCGKSGIFFQGLRNKGRAGDFVPNLITNCIIYGGNYGIELESSLVTNIVACEIYMTQSVGFYLHDHSNSTLISGCRTFQIQDDAVRVVDSHELNISSNIFCWHDGHGIVLENVIWGNVNGNNVIDTGHINIIPEGGNFTSYWVDIPDSLNMLDSLKSGVYITNETRGVTISGNAIFNWGSNAPLKHGIEEDQSCANNNFVSNNINYSHFAGIKYKGSNSIESNNIIEKEKPYLGGDNIDKQRFHRYDPRKVQRFIEETRINH